MFFDEDDRYKDRETAAYALAKELRRYKGEDGVVLAIPRGAVPMGVIIAEELGFDLDLALSKKIGHPLQPEFAIGAVSLTDSILDVHEDVPQSYVTAEVARIRARLREMYREFMGSRKPVDLSGKTVIIVDDGIATGNTVLSTVKMIRKESPGKIVIAVPVASQRAIALLLPMVDEIVCPLVPENFMGVGQFYEDFEQVSDEEVKTCIEKFLHKRGGE